VSDAAATLIEKTAANPADLLSIDPPLRKMQRLGVAFRANILFNNIDEFEQVNST
jgi:hypothetical protein